MFDDFDTVGSDDEDVSGGYSDGVDRVPSILAVIMIAMNLIMMIF